MNYRKTPFRNKELALGCAIGWNLIQGVDWMLKEENYPMTYKEYEKRVVELFLEPYEGDALQHMIEVVNEELSKDPNFIHGLYGHSCFTYDNPELYGEDCKRCFEDNFLMQTPVANLRMLLDGL